MKYNKFVITSNSIDSVKKREIIKKREVNEANSKKDEIILKNIIKINFL